jgi:hypothetical protein
VDFASDIYPCICNKILDDNSNTTREYKTEWQLCISTPELKGNTFRFFKKKFNLDDEFSRNIGRHDEIDIAFRFITPEMDIGAKWVSNVGAIIFDLPAEGMRDTTEEYR